MRIRNSKFAITGANRGIGLAVARMAAANGAHVYAIARSWEPGYEEELKSLGAASVHLLKANLSTREQTDQLAWQLADADLDILFNNAGILTGGLLEEQHLDDIFSMFQVNLLALVHLTHAVLPGMVRKRRGKIINNSSVSAYMHFPCASTYAASKAAVAAFSNCLRAELEQTGVSVLCLVTPGIKTRMFDEIEMKYAKNFETPKDSITADEYAEKIRRAIESDVATLEPSGATGVGLWIARHLNPVFRFLIRSKFKRDSN